MLRNYFKIAFRNLIKSRIYSTINILGLAAGMACCLVIFLFVKDELSYDKHHANRDRIFRVLIQTNDLNRSSSRIWAAISAGYGPRLRNAFPNIQSSVRFWPWTNPVIEHGDRKLVEENFCFVEGSIFDIFTLPFIAGDPATALEGPNKAVITRTAAQKYFGDADPLGKQLIFRSRGQQLTFQITGLIQDFPSNSHINFDLLASFATFEKNASEVDFEFLAGNFNYPTYVLLRDQNSVQHLTAQFPDFLDRSIEEDDGRKPHERFEILLQPLGDIYLNSDFHVEYAKTGSATMVYVLAIVAALILLIACVNFINLATARAARRAQEIGVRKVLGAHRSQVIRQFLGESLLLSVLALILAVGCIELILPWFNEFAGKTLDLDLWRDHTVFAALIATVAIAGLLAGSYPALAMSRYRPVQALRGQMGTRPSGSVFRSALVVLQFAISIALIISVGIIERQIDYVTTKNLGFEQEQLVAMRASAAMLENFESFKHRLEQHPGIVSVTASSRIPSGALNDALDARILQAGQEVPVEFRLPFIWVDHAFFATYGMDMVAGRSFSPDLASDSSGAYVLNETAVAQLGWTPEEAIGKAFRYGGREGRIIGVVRDFHFESLHQRIKPILFAVAPFLRRISARLVPERIPEALAFLEQQWRIYRPDYPFSFNFIDQQFAQHYQSEQRLGEIVKISSGLAIFVACLGLLGLATFAAEQRTKEIGIRKVLGATVRSIFALLSKDFLKYVLLANLIAWPLAFFVMRHWLSNFAYQTDLGFWAFLSATGLALVFALATVSIQSLKAAFTQPVDTLRHE